MAAAVLAAGVGELAAAVVAPASSPFAVIGAALIDLAPPWAKDTAIAWFGTADKIALLVGIAIVMLAVAAGAGLLEAARAPLGEVVVGASAAVGVVVAVTRSDATGIAWLPSALAGLAGVIAIRYLVRLAVGSAPGAVPHQPPVDTEVPRRRFLAWTGAAGVVGVLALIGGNLARAGERAVTAARDALGLPAPAVKAPPVPAGAELDIPGLARIVTPNDAFYRIDTALVVPEVDPAGWSLRIHGMVEREVVISWNELVSLPLEESYTTLACVSNPVGGTLIGNAKWLGYPIRELLARAAPSADADMVLSTSIDGFSASTPLDVLTDDRASILAVGMNDEPLPIEHGFPVRMVVPGLYGYVSATKWVVDLEVTRFDRSTAYWTTRGWSARGPIKLQSRIDVPRRGQGLTAGDTVIAGVAWQQHVGVSGVEVQIDEGPWVQASLAPAISDDTWVQWSLPWTATEGSHLIRCRAISATGEVQTEERAAVAPDGATGWDERFLEVFS
ncbi:molybdopterin-dependent oxidoreductase [Microbacterium awajiense]